MKCNEAFSAIEHHLTSLSYKQAWKLKGEAVMQPLVLKMEEQEEVYDEFEGIKLIWSLRKTVSNSKAMALRNRQRKLYINCTSHRDNDKQSDWSHVIFDHPASFETIAMDPIQKKEIVDDFTAFGKAKEYYARMGKPWKRGYLLYGPPGTGKSTLVAAIANFLRCDIYDIELTSVPSNAELRKLLIGIRSKSVVVIEGIDCSLDLTSQRKTISKSVKGEDENDAVNSVQEQVKLFAAAVGKSEGKTSKALIRRRRMDMHIELPYCGFEGFKVSAKNYLSVESHFLFAIIRQLLQETNITPADVAENLMPKVIDEDVETSLLRLVKVLRTSKERQG
ncbi:hypothetical protein RJT34_27871 [Clitoria ternatea]|uniref:AAA+ ATPase domain-containing protein n=1 Tax=Clitoria ternatea TaxID=43366 RepID=A0AAN9I9Y8_CLITE